MGRKEENLKEENLKGENLKGENLKEENLKGEVIDQINELINGKQIEGRRN